MAHRVYLTWLMEVWLVVCGSGGDVSLAVGLRESPS